jgi:dolichyl-diphosphooligosaccharide--protein glycosyltransferase
MASSKSARPRMPFDAAVLTVVFLLYTLSNTIYHSNTLAAEAYSSPSIIMSSRRNDGTRYIIDDYREAYYWLKQNTPKESKIMSWWDYGYQITGMSNRTVIVDNNTWNNTHIATVGRAMSSDEETAYKIARSLDANYVLVIFGGMSHYSGDDISKFLWMVRIAAGVYP